MTRKKSVCNSVFATPADPTTFLKKTFSCLKRCGRNLPVYVRAIILAYILCSFLPEPAAAEVVGALMPAKDIPHYTAMHNAMLNEFKARGNPPKFILQNPAASADSWKNAIRKFDVLGSRVLVTYGSAVSAFVTRLKPEFPVVYGGAFYPDESGVAGNVTGMDATMPLAELLQNLKTISNYSRLAILYSSRERDSVLEMEAAERIVLQSGGKVIKIDAHDVNFLDQADYDVVFSADFFDLSGAEAALLTSASNINSRENIGLIAKNLLTNGKASASVFSGTCEMGILISSSASPEYLGKGMALKIMEVLEGESPANIPPGRASKSGMTVNLTTAKKLGFSVPFELLGTAEIVK
ncbi:MAG: hypothetical protein KKG47_07175 [Proteobacteria bacterium]|nr:hypothetical protein [Pseudomonadota bacterium]MBU1737846.1 hypothetical protein [Pseudomonadota bacterium]